MVQNMHKVKLIIHRICDESSSGLFNALNSVVQMLLSPTLNSLLSLIASLIFSGHDE